MAWAIGLVDFSGKSEVQSDGRCVASYMRKYLVRTDAAVMQPESVVAAAVGITRGSPIASDPNAICNSVEITPGPVPTRPPFLAYFATYQFSTATVAPEDDDDDPTTSRTLWSISPQIQSRYVIRDRNGKLIVNTAKQPFDGGIPMDVRLGSATATRRKDAAGYDRSTVLANSGKLNSVTFMGGAPGTVQVDISASERYEGAFHFWEETYTFAYDPQGWQPKPISAGFFQRLSIDPMSPNYDKLKRIINSDIGDTNDPTAGVQEPEPLNAAGVIVPIADRPDACVFVTVELFDEMDFEDFGL